MREHLLIDGKSTDLRLIYNPQDNLYRIVRDKGGSSMEAVVDRLPVTANGTPIIPRDALGNLNLSKLSLPKTAITLGAATTITQYERALPATLPYTASARTVQEIAGYVGDKADQARFRQLTLQFGDGSTKKLELLQSAKGGAYDEVFYDKTGVEYLLTPVAGQADTFRVKAVQPNTALGAQSRITEIPQGAVLVPSMGKLTRERMEELGRQGLMPVAVLGTGFISYTDDKTAVPVGFHFTRNPDGTTQVVNQLGSRKIFAGYLVRKNGEMEMLDFKKDGYDVMLQKLQALQNDPDVTSINVFSHVAATKPEDLVGVMGSTLEPTREPRSRSLRVFDSNKKMVGHIVTPPVGLLDTVNVARQVYGDRAAYTLNVDGDFYAHTALVEQGKVTNARVLNFRNSMIVARPLLPGEQPFVDNRNGAQKALDDVGYSSAVSKACSRCASPASTSPCCTCSQPVGSAAPPSAARTRWPSLGAPAAAPPPAPARSAPRPAACRGGPARAASRLQDTRRGSPG